MKNFLLSLFTALILSSSILLSADVEDQDNSPVKIEMLSEPQVIKQGESFCLALRFDLEENWHTYWKNPGDSGMPAEIEWKLPQGFKVHATHWQAPIRFTLDSAVGFGYENEMILLVDVEAPESLNDHSNIEIEAHINWLACSDSMCLPGNSVVTKSLPVDNKIQNSASEYFTLLRQNLPKNHWDLQTGVENDNFIELKIKAPKDHEFLYTAGYFCPEDAGFIDHKEMTYFKHLETSDDVHYNFNLKKLADTKNSHLKGVLVLFHEKENEMIKESLTVNLPLKSQNNELIASLDKSEIKKAQSDFNIREEVPSEFENNFGMALLFAFVGGMLLNLMPCVLPVLSLKIFSFVKMAGESKKLSFQHGLAFSFGVIVSFWVLAGMLLILQAYGNAVGWGFQLQEPIFVAVLASIIFILGLNLFGVMELGTGMTSLAGNISHKKEGLTSSFLSGILATAIATPCTGPFLGSAVGYAVTLPSYLALIIFTTLGAGMAFPYLLLSAYPNLLRFIPKPGNWMIAFKEIMGFLMMATTVWLLWVFGAETSSSSMIYLIGAFLFFAIASWIYGKWGSPLQSKLKRKLSYIFSLGFLALGIYVISVAISPSMVAESSSHQGDEIASNWEPYSRERIAELQKEGIPVFVDFTAKWCLICQTNHMALTTNHAEDKFDNAKVVRMKADWTKKDPIITEELRKFGRNSVPLYVLYGTDPQEKPQVLPQVLTSGIVSDYIDNLH